MNDIEYIMSEKSRIDLFELLENKVDMEQLENLKYYDIPKALYKYTCLNKNTLENLKNKKITATVPTEFNDLYDSTMHFDSYSETLELINQLNDASKRIGLKEIINHEQKDNYLKDSSSSDEHRLSYLTKDFRISCFSTNSKDIKMWSHYADKNKGICINYNFNKSINNINKLIYPVIYIDTPVVMNKICEDLDKVITAVLCSIISKFRDWQHEKEWRIIDYSPFYKTETIPLIIIPEPEFIILGSKFIKSYKEAEDERGITLTIIEEFLDYVNKSNIKLKIVKPQIRSFNLEFNDIDVDEIKKEKSRYID